MSALLVKQIIFHDFNNTVHFAPKSFKETSGHTVDSKVYINGNSTKTIGSVEVQPYKLSLEIENTTNGYALKEFLVNLQLAETTTVISVIKNNGETIRYNVRLDERVEVGNDSSGFTISLVGDKAI